MYDVNVNYQFNSVSTNIQTAMDIAKQLCKESGGYVSVKTQDTKVLLYAVSLCKETQCFIEYNSYYTDPFQ